MLILGEKLDKLDKSIQLNGFGSSKIKSSDLSVINQISWIDAINENTIKELKKLGKQVSTDFEELKDQIESLKKVLEIWKDSRKSRKNKRKRKLWTKN